MKKIIFCDINESLVKKVDTLFKKFETNKWGISFSTHHGDIFKYQKENGGHIATASNPSFSMGGGLDAQIAMRFSSELDNPKEFKLTENLFFTVTVDSYIKATEKIVERALIGAFGYSEKEIIISGFGTSIGGLSDDKFLEVLEKVCDADMRDANMSGANMSGANMRCADMRDANMSGANMSGANMRCADMSGANMSGANMRGANMRGANMSGVNMRGANMRGANISGANMSDVNMSGADMIGANMSDVNMSGANISGADMSGANISGAKMIGADMSGANMSGVNMIGANMRCADMSGANMSGANMRGANMSGANMRGADNLDSVSFNEGTAFFALACPEEGSFTAWKKASGNIIKLEIPEDAKRSSATSRKCRASKAKVIAIYNSEGKEIKECFSSYDLDFIYKTGKVVEPTEPYEEDRWNECASGIHFFITKKEAEQWN